MFKRAFRADAALQRHIPDLGSGFGEHLDIHCYRERLSGNCEALTAQHSDGHCSVNSPPIYLFKRMGNIYTESQELLSEFLPACSTPWFGRTCKAYRPLRVNVGSFYYADRTLVLTILTIILTNTASLVMACLS